MVNPVTLILGILAVIAAGVLAVLFAVKLFTFVWYVLRHLWRFVSGEVVDVLRLAGAILTSVVMVPLVLLNVVIGRWSAAAHFGRSFTGEIRAVGSSLYRIALGHPARLLGLSALTEGIEKRVPMAIAEAPGADQPSKRTGQFEGYTIVGSLPGGGSGSKLYVAEPDARKKAVFARLGRQDLRQVVIKSFSLVDGSSLPQIVRESRSLDAAKKLGLVLDHDLTPDRFFYVMEYVPGQSLSAVTQQLHAASAPGGLDDQPLRLTMAYAVDLLRTLDTYHRGGLWHKDVKPDNIIVDGQRAHLVDFGLVTPLRSAMTLTTHGTEYFRDPEMVRLALKGVKVHEVDGTRFDLFAAGAVLYSVIENSFPAHGVLSQITKRCPEALRWIVRRAMTDYDKRYPTASAMAEDLAFVARHPDLFAVKPFELPSMRGAAGVDDTAPSARVDPEIAQVAAAGTPRPAPAEPQARPQGPRTAPKLMLSNWWTGAYRAEGRAPGAPPAPAGDSVPVVPAAAPFAEGLAARRVERARETRRPAVEQLARARARVVAARTRGTARIARRAQSRKPFETKMNWGVLTSAGLFVLGCVVATAAWVNASSRRELATLPPPPPDAPTVEVSAPDDAQLWARSDVRVVSMPTTPTPVAGDDHADGKRVYEIGRDGARTFPTSRVVPAAQRASGAVLAIIDLPKPLTGVKKATLGQMVASLRTVGFDILGDVPDNDAAPDELRAQLDLTARAIAACGEVGPETETARGNVSEWLAQSNAADLVLWVRQRDVSDSGEPVLEWFLVAPAREGMDPDRARQSVNRFEAGVTALREDH